MRGFTSHAASIEKFLKSVVVFDEQHAKWLNTLSYLENCGARKIAACEHPTLVMEEMLKHAAEEFRHAHYLKSQIKKIWKEGMDTYSPALLLGGRDSLHHLNLLDLKTSRYLKEKGLSVRDIKEAAYLLVTYAIELRANELYHIYDDVLKNIQSKVMVKSILLEEKEHLNEMQEGISKIKFGFEYAEQVCKIEGELCGDWLKGLSKM